MFYEKTSIILYAILGILVITSNVWLQKNGHRKEAREIRELYKNLNDKI